MSDANGTCECLRAGWGCNVTTETKFSTHSLELLFRNVISRMNYQDKERK